MKNSLIVNVVKKSLNIHEKWKDTKGLILVKNPLFVDFVTKKYSQSGQVKRHSNDSHW